MYNVSESFKTCSAAADRQMEIKATIDSVAYTNAEIIEFDIEDALVAGDDFTLGSVVSSKLSISVKTTNTIASNAPVIPEVRFYNGTTWTEWLKLGTYYIDSRTINLGVYKFECYDRIILSNQIYVSALTYPATMADIMDEIAFILSLTLDSSVVIDPVYTVDYKDEDVTLRAMLGYIASAHGANLKLLKDTNKLAFVFAGSVASVATITGSQYFKMDQTNPTKTYTKAVCVYNTDGEFWEHGTGDADATLTFFNPHVKEAWMPSIHTQIDGMQYTPMRMDWRGRPEIEVGDTITIQRLDTTAFTTVSLINTLSFKSGLKEISSSPSYSPQKSEFDYAGELKSLIRSVAASSGGLQEDTPYYGVTIGKIYGLKVTRDDEQARVILNSDIFTFQVWDSVTETWVSSLYFDAVNKKYVFDGVLSANVIEAVAAEIDVVISQTVIVQNLYASMGNVADLTVNRLETSDKVQRYLNSDTSRMDFIRVEGKEITFIEAVVKTGNPTEQVTSPNGDLMYWVDETETAMTIEVTDYPVTVYQYDEVVKMKMFYELDGETGYYVPRMAWGAGAGVVGYPERGKGFIEKDGDGFKLSYLNEAGTEYSIILGETGILMGGYQGLSDLDFYSNGFKATYGGYVLGYRWTKDGDGKITQLEDIYTEDVVNVTWGSGTL